MSLYIYDNFYSLFLTPTWSQNNVHTYKKTQIMDAIGTTYNKVAVSLMYLPAYFFNSLLFFALSFQLLCCSSNDDNLQSMITTEKVNERDEEDEASFAGEHTSVEYE